LSGPFFVFLREREWPAVVKIKDKQNSWILGS